MSEPFFSILVPVFNQVGKMDDCLNSIRSQTFGDYEVIFVDDGSTDGSYDYLNGLAEEDKRYSVYRHDKNLSLLCARFTGMKNAAGKYIIFLDSDDAIDNDTLEVLHSHIESKPVDITRYGFVTVPGAAEFRAVGCDDPLKAIYEGKIPPAIWKNCVAAGVIKKAVENVEPFYCNNGEDTFMSTILFTFAESFSEIDRCFYKYNISGGMSRNSSLTTEKLGRILQSFDRCTENVAGFIAKYRPELNEACIRACHNMYEYEMCHFMLCAEDERKLIDFLNGFNRDELSDVYDFGCRQVLPEYFARKHGKQSEDKLKFKFF